MEEGMKSLISVYNRLQDLQTNVGRSAFQGINLNLPQIVVVGTQSAGKSSVLEGLVGRDFLPRGTEIVTRVPLVLQLVHTSKGDVQETEEDEADIVEEWGEFLHRKGEKFYDFDQIREEIESQTDVLAGHNKGVIDCPINLSIHSPHVVNLTLVDLPGTTRNPVGDQPEDIKTLIKEMIRKYITPENAVILAVSPANQDISTSDAIKMARKHDPEGDRTLAVLTKLDLMDEGTDATQVLENKVIKVKLGYIGVVNRSQQNINDNKPIKDCIADEKVFLSKTYPHLAAKCGMPYLARCLHEFMMESLDDDQSSNSSWDDLSEVEKKDDIAVNGNAVVAVKLDAMIMATAVMPRSLGYGSRSLRTWSNSALVVVEKEENCFTSIYELLGIPFSDIASSVSRAFRKAAKEYLSRKTNSVKDYEHYKLITAAYNKWKLSDDHFLQIRIPSSGFITQGMSMRFHLLSKEDFLVQVTAHLSMCPDTLKVFDLDGDIALKLCPALFDGSLGDFPVKIGVEDLYGLLIIQEGIKLASAMDTTITDALHLVFRRMDEKLMSAFVRFLFKREATLLTVCEVACSEAHYLVAPFGMTVDSYVGNWVAIALKMRGPYWAMKIADRFEQPRLVVQIGVQYVLKGHVKLYDKVENGVNILYRSRAISRRYRRSDEHFIKLKENGLIEGKYICPFYWEMDKIAGKLVRTCEDRSLRTRIEVEAHVSMKHYEIEERLLKCVKCNMAFVYGDSDVHNVLFKAEHDIYCRARAPPHMPGWAPSVSVSQQRRVAKLPRHYVIPQDAKEAIIQLNFDWLGRMYVMKPWLCYDAKNGDRYVFRVVLRGPVFEG